MTDRPGADPTWRTRGSRAIDDASLLKRFKRAIAGNDLPRHCNPAVLTRYIVTVNFGLAVQAATGASRAELRNVVDAVLKSAMNVIY